MVLPNQSPRPVYDPFDLPISFPDLEQQTFNAADGLLRMDANLLSIPFASSIITRDEIRTKQPVDMFDAIQNEVGVLIQRTARGQASPVIRGLQGPQVLLLIDGIRMNNGTYRSGANQYFNTIDPGQVEQIQIIRGPQSVLWGADAIGGVVNTVTRSANLSRGLRENYVGMGFTDYFATSDYSNYSRLNVEGFGGSVGVFGGGSFLNVRDLDTAGPLGRQPYTNYQQYAGDLKLNFLLSDTQMLTLAFQHFELEDVPRSDRFRPFNNVNPSPTFFDPQQRDLAYLRWQGTPDSGLVDGFTITGSYQRQREGQRFANAADQTTRIATVDTESLGFNAVFVSELGCFGRMVYGTDFYHDDVDSTQTSGRPIYPDDSYYQRAGAFWFWDVRLTDRLSSATGVRYEMAEAAGSPFVSNVPTFFKTHYQDWVFSTSLAYEVTPDLFLVGTISEGFRPPNIDDLMPNNQTAIGTDIPSTNLRPEHSLTYELGYKFNGEQFRSQGFVYWNDFDDYILRNSAGAGNFQRSNRDSSIQGVEWDGEFLLRGGWAMYGNFWYTFGRGLRINGIDFEPLPKISPTQGNLGLRWRSADFANWFDIYAWMVRRQDRVDSQTDASDNRIPLGANGLRATPGFATLNMRFGRALDDVGNHIVSLSLLNILDQPYRVHGSGVDGPGFTAQFGYQVGY